MAISHLCLGCGFDLARVRTRPDPHYALPLVVCPDCGEAAVRRVHPHQVGWRAFLRVKASIIALVIQLGLLSGAAAAVIGVCVEGERWARGNLIATSRQEMTFGLIAFGVVPIAVGAWLSGGLGHLGRIRAWSLFTIVVAGVIFLDCIGAPLLRRLLEAGGLSLVVGDLRWVELSGRLVVLAGIMSVATAGIPLGMLVRAGHRSWHRNRRRARRRRIRSRRTRR